MASCRWGLWHISSSCNAGPPGPSRSVPPALDGTEFLGLWPQAVGCERAAGPALALVCLRLGTGARARPLPRIILRVCCPCIPSRFGLRHAPSSGCVRPDARNGECRTRKRLRLDSEPGPARSLTVTVSTPAWRKQRQHNRDNCRPAARKTHYGWGRSPLQMTKVT